MNALSFDAFVLLSLVFALAFGCKCLLPRLMSFGAVPAASKCSTDLQLARLNFDIGVLQRQSSFSSLSHDEERALGLLLARRHELIQAQMASSESHSVSGAAVV